MADLFGYNPGNPLNLYNPLSPYNKDKWKRAEDRKEHKQRFVCQDVEHPCELIQPNQTPAKGTDEQQNKASKEKPR